MNTPWMLITGVGIVGWLLPEALAAFGGVRVPAAMNVLGAVAGALIAGSFVL